MLDRKRLSIYLNDHLAGSTSGLELAKRTRGANQGTEYAEPLERVASQIEEDRDALIRLMESLEIKRDHLKVAAGWPPGQSAPSTCWRTNGRDHRYPTENGRSGR